MSKMVSEHSVSVRSILMAVKATARLVRRVQRSRVMRQVRREVVFSAEAKRETDCLVRLE